MQPVRFCQVRYNILYRSDTGGGKTTGAEAPDLDLMLEKMRGLNVSRVWETSIGRLLDAKDGVYDGCLGSLQKNTYLAVKMSHPGIPMLLFRSLMWGTQMFVACFLRKQATVPRRVTKLTTISAVLLILTLTGFLFLFFLTSLIETQIVVGKRPRTIKSFKDILHWARRPVWLSIFSDAEDSRLASRRKLKRRLWDWYHEEADVPPAILEQYDQLVTSLCFGMFLAASACLVMELILFCCFKGLRLAGRRRRRIAPRA